ncbi:RluA family pseudouridine synthase [Terrihabitans rhizophilus]|uniref:Pseudouridine synthase n=1 Tax=Terrihabitans rhizophilus TaxID=3092662 RepID=A0ABU4RRH9_9HYPH|nr:RluA family pseudouridine synthase [Terrihabitans sp. PJ23]MDX6807462.1 RluA family pseudouridine synthase [Terrihabitans sp. PJ23]
MSDPDTRLDVVLAPELAGERLDRALAQALPDLSRTRIQALIRAGKVELSGAIATDLGAKVAGGEQAFVHIPPPEPALPLAEAIPLNVVYEDDELIVIDKPAGLVVHPGAGNWTGTLVNALLAHCAGSLSGIGGVERPGIVHRLDKDTTGLLVAAKTDRAHRSLAEQFADHGRTGPLERAYMAFVWGSPLRTSGTVDAPIDRDPRNREKMRVCPPEHGREAITHWHRLRAFGPPNAALVSLVRCELETGRTHQIRVHMAHLGHPVLGDPAYGAGFKTKARHLPEAARASLEGLGRQALHAAHLAFEHPATGELMSFDSALPPDLAELAEALKTTP